MKLRFLKPFIIPLLIVLGYLILVSYPYFSSKINRYDALGFLSLIEEKSVKIKESDKADNHLIKHEKITAKLNATENNLGIVLIRFARFGNVSDQVLFRIKEEGEAEWYYENDYRANQFQSGEYFTFGFPPIAKSQNKIYVFEIESLSGTYKNGIGLSPKKPQAALVYRYSKDDLKNFNKLISFISKKFLYVLRNSDFLANWQLLAAFVLPILFVLFIQKREFTFSQLMKFLLTRKRNRRAWKVIINKIRFNYLSLEKKIVKFSKKINRSFTSTKFYLLFFNTNTKRRLAISLLIFLIAFLYRFSATLVDQLGVSLFYAGFGGQGDYDQFIRAATCAVRNFYSCPLVLHQNLLIESSILGTFYGIFGFIGGLKAYLYLMLIASSVVATLPYLLLSKKSWISIGGIIGSLFLATSDFLTQVALNYPPDNGSTFTFSMFFLVYLLTMHFGTIRWLLFFGFVGFFDGMFKALFLINDLVAFAFFSPVFFYEKARQTGKLMFQKKNMKILFLSLIPLIVFLVPYLAWEYFVHAKWEARYFLGGLIESGGSAFITYTVTSHSASNGNLLLISFTILISAFVMVQRLLEYTQLQIFFLASILLGLLFVTFIKSKFPFRKFVVTLIFSIVIVTLLTLIKSNYFGIHEIFSGDNIGSNWVDQTYIKIFLFYEIIFLFILNFRYSAIRLSLPIIPYVIMLIILTKNSPFPRISTQVVVWSIILLAYLIDWTFMNINKYSMKRIKIILGPVFLILFICLYSLPGIITMISHLSSGFAAIQNEVKYLSWVDQQLPNNAIILAGGKSDLVTLGENISKPIAYSTLWTGAVLIRPNEIPGVLPADFTLISELQNKSNFKKKKYLILEDDIFVWRARLTGAGDGVFTTNPKFTSALHAKDYSIKVYRYNPILKKAIYELNIQENESID